MTVVPPPILAVADPRVVDVHGPAPRRKVASTMSAPGVAEWQDVTVVPSEAPPRVLARAIFRAARSHDALVVNGSGRLRSAQFVAATALRARSQVPAVVVAEASWEDSVAGLNRLGRPGRALGRAVAHGSLRALDAPHLTYCVLSREELDLLPRHWGIPAERVRCTPYHFALWGLRDQEPDADAETYLFSGGTPLRDYSTLIEAVRGLPWPVRIATTAELGAVPRNVWVGTLSHAEYMDQMRDAAAIVVPLAATTTRSAGHQTYLNAMALGKPLIVTDAMGVRDYVEPERTGIVVPLGDPVAMRAALQRVIREVDDEGLAQIAARAKAVAQEHLGPWHYWGRLRALADERGAAATAP